MNSYTFHINLYDVAFTGAIFIGLVFAVLLWSTKTVNHSANRFLALALATMIVWMVRILAIDIRLETYLPGWDRLPMQFLLALGPLTYFYVLKITRPQYQFKWKDLLHFSPLLLEQAALAVEIRESARTGAATYATHTFQQLDPVLQLLIFISIMAYVRQCDKLIQKFYRGLQPVLMDRPLLEFRWLRRLLAATALLWLLWVFCAAVYYFGYRNQPGIHAYYPFYIFFVAIIIWTAVAAFLKPQAAVVAQKATPVRQPVPAELRLKGVWIKKAMEAKLYYQDPDLSLSTLAEKVSLHPNELSRVINTVFKKSFNDFINEYRVRDMVCKMNDPAYDNMTLLGIAFESGFNSQSTFNRIFKQLTGKSAAEFKKSLKKEHPSYNLSGRARFSPVISHQQTAPKWTDVKLNRNYMFRNYVKIAWRNLWKNKVYSSINIIGLAVGMAACILIMLFVSYEKSFDNFQTKNIYRLNEVQKYEGASQKVALSMFPMGPTMQKAFPEIKNFTRINWAEKLQMVNKDKHIFLPMTYIVDSTFLQLFNFKLLEGNKETVLQKPNSIILTQSSAEKLFGKENPVGKTIMNYGDDTTSFIVTGVLENVPQNSQLQFDALYSFSTIYSKNPDMMNSWGGNWLDTYFELGPNTNVAALENKFPAYLKKYLPNKNGWKNLELFLLPFKQVHAHAADIVLDYLNYQKFDGEYTNIFFATALVVLLIACINFMNLSTASSEKRAKEVGVRKVVGAGKKSLIGQFLAESFFITFISGLLAIIIVQLCLPAFNQLVQRQLFINYTSIYSWIAAIGFILFTAMLSGSYPAFFLSAFKPIAVLKGTFKKLNTSVTPRKVLVVLQFTFAIVLIISTLIIEQQIKYTQQRETGYDKKNLGYVFMQGNINKNYELIKNALLSSGVATSVSKTQAPLTQNWSSADGMKWQGKDPNAQILINLYAEDGDLVKTAGMQLVKGRDIDIKNFPSDSTACLISESAVKVMGFKNPIGQNIFGNSVNWHVVGVIKDFILESPYEPIKPFMVEGPKGGSNVIYIRFNSARTTAKNMATTEGIFKQYNADYPFEFHFADEEYAQKFSDELLTETLVSIFASLIIFISCLGLFGLTTYMAASRIKEIGVRKVLGASITSITLLLSKDFMKLVAISIVIASPIAWWTMHEWLQNYDYRISISWWIFLAAGISAILIALITISFQSIKAALSNPVNSLRSE